MSQYGLKYIYALDLSNVMLGIIVEDLWEENNSV